MYVYITIPYTKGFKKTVMCCIVCFFFMPQSSVETSTDVEKSSDNENGEPKVTITFAQMVNNFSNIFKGIAKREGLNDPCHMSIGINQIKTFLDEFSKAR